ncbi:hypothetical protein GCM10012285_17340 [Streptomyces kronopolitis]|uniref:Uncharacterized protein n=1 Tax=Streptomyces kronopolitis TaxID=1612435 RepID=A0ABQ2J462_9ACTN|nr:hypothetical protein GCM10012285_17340 [Streptomyces kronopolitis]
MVTGAMTAAANAAAAMALRMRRAGRVELSKVPPWLVLTGGLSVARERSACEGKLTVVMVV